MRESGGKHACCRRQQAPCKTMSSCQASTGGLPWLAGSGFPREPWQLLGPCMPRNLIILFYFVIFMFYL